MGTKSTSGDAFSDSMKEKIADHMYVELTGNASRLHPLYEMIKDGFEGVNSMDDRELFRRAMMYGLLDEDAGEDR